MKIPLKWPLMRVSQHDRVTTRIADEYERLLAESHKNAKIAKDSLVATHKAKLADATHKSDRLLDELTPKLMKLQLEHDSRGFGNGGAWRWIVTLDERMTEEFFRWGNDDHIISLIAERAGRQLENELRQRNHLRMAPDSRYEFGHFGADRMSFR